MTTSSSELPKAVLHDHLDGGLRVETIVELADEVGHRLPASDPAALAAWFRQDESGSLEAYLEAFAHTTALMQTKRALERVAREAVVDLAADGVRYAELRFAPTLHTARGLEPGEVVAAVAAGIAAGEADTGCVASLIVVAMRTMSDSEEVAKLAVSSQHLGVVGFDIAGAEAGYPPRLFRAACHHALDANLPVTLHAGEAEGPSSIAQALHQCGAQRIGHGVRIIEDCEVDTGDITTLGDLARFVRDRQIPLEVNLSSNLDTGLYPSAPAHPIGSLHRAGFAVTVNTDNRLMSGTSMSNEFALLASSQGFGLEDFHAVTTTALRAGFAAWPTRRRLLDEVDETYRRLGSTR
jgi:adenosine deaminase